MRLILKFLIAIFVATGILVASSCNRNIGKNAGEGCGTWSKVKTQDSTELNKGI